MAAHSSILPRKFQGQRSLAGYSPGCHKESDTTKYSTHTSTQDEYIFLEQLPVFYKN